MNRVIIVLACLSVLTVMCITGKDRSTIPKQNSGPLYRPGGKMRGPRPLENVTEKIFQILPQFRKVWKTTFDVSPPKECTVVLKFDIDDSGNVLNCRTSEQTCGDESFATELRSILLRHNFGLYEGSGVPTEVVYPLFFVD